MVNDLTRVDPVQGYRVLQVIWGGMILGVGILAAVALFAPLDSRVAVSVPSAALVLGVIAGVLFAVQLKIRENLSDGKLFPRVLDLDSWGLGAEAAIRLKELRVPERGAQLILQAHVILGIITWALAEVMAVLGLILTFLTGEPRFMAVFGVIALLELMWFRPARRTYEGQMVRWGRYVESHRAGQGEPPPEG
ncbi:MAG: hypothetical protein RRA32_10835 [bacterium]|nr:hypothetical protein [bacterium]